MTDLLFIVPARNLDSLHRTLSMLAFQKDKDFRTFVLDLTGSSAAAAVTAEFEPMLSVAAADLDASGELLWKRCLEAAPAADWVCFLNPDVELNETSVKRMRRCIADHSGYDVFHWNLAEPYKKLRLKTRPDKLFIRIFTEGGEAPLSSFVFRSQALRDAFADDPDAAGMDLAVILAAARKTGIRSARRERIGYRKPGDPTDPAVVEKEVRARLAFFRWSERYFGDDYPLDTGERLALFAGELARLYPSYTVEELKEYMDTFAVVNGPIRKMRASSALKAALKKRQESLR